MRRRAGKAAVDRRRQGAAGEGRRGEKETDGEQAGRGGRKEKEREEAGLTKEQAGGRLWN